MSLAGVTLPSKTLPLLARVVLTSVAVASMLGMWHVPGLGMGRDGEMRGCPLMVGMATLCTMNTFEHLAVWQRMFTAIPSTLGPLLLFLSMWVFLAVRFWRVLHPPNDPLRVSHRLRERLRLLFVPPDSLKEAFSRGILHPKIYG